MSRKRKPYPKDEDEILALLQNMAAKAALNQTPLGWTAPEVSQLVEDAANFEIVMEYAGQLEDSVNAFYRAKDELFDGEPDVSTNINFAGIPALSFGAGHSFPGINKRAKNLIKRGVLGAGYTEQIGDDMGWLEDEGAGAFSFDTVTAALTIASHIGGEVRYEFLKQGTGGIRIEEQDAEGAWQHAGDYSTSPIVRTVDGPHPRVIKTRGRHLVKDQPVGNYSPTYDTVTQP